MAFFPSCFGATSDNAQGLVTPGSTLKNYYWQCLGDHMGYLGIEPGSVMCKANALPAVLLLQH